MLAAVKFIWRATRGHRLCPWRSPYLRWRIETFSGMEAERVGFSRFIAFCWRERRGLWRFLRWSGAMSGYRGRSLHPVQSSQAGPSDTG